MGRPMGLGGLGDQALCFKRKFRWLMSIPNVVGELKAAVDVLPPLKSARPNIAFKEIAVEHLTETIYYPSKPDYKPITLTCYDIVTNNLDNPVFNWIKECYDASNGTWSLAADGLMQDVNLDLYDGCGNIIETWIFENAFPQQVDFGDLDMGSSDVITCDLTLRYARAYLED